MSEAGLDLPSNVKIVVSPNPEANPEQIAATMVVKTIKFGMELTEQGVKIHNTSPLTGEFKDFQDSPKQKGSGFDPQAGYFDPNTKFASTRDAWCKLRFRDLPEKGLPHVRGYRGDTGEFEVAVTANSDAGTDFNDYVLPSSRIHTIIINNRGEIKGIVGDSWRSLTNDELAKLGEIFNNGHAKLERIKELWDNKPPQSTSL